MCRTELKKVYKMHRLCVNQEECTEIQCNTVFKTDAYPDNVERELNVTYNQHHLMRSVFWIISFSEKGKGTEENFCVKKES